MPAASVEPLTAYSNRKGKMTEDALGGSSSSVLAYRNSTERGRSRNSLNSADQFSNKEVAMSAEAIWVLAERPSGEHIAQLYSHETVLVESLRMFTTHGLLRGEAVLLVLTPSHRQVLLQHLQKEGVDVDGLQRAGQLLLLDAEKLLASFMRGRMPDGTLFNKSLGEVVASIRPNGGNRKVRVFGEMVDLLWKSNQPARAMPDAAVRPRMVAIRRAHVQSLGQTMSKRPVAKDVIAPGAAFGRES